MLSNSIMFEIVRRNTDELDVPVVPLHRNRKRNTDELDVPDVPLHRNRKRNIRIIAPEIGQRKPGTGLGVGNPPLYRNRQDYI